MRHLPLLSLVITTSLWAQPSPPPGAPVAAPGPSLELALEAVQVTLKTCSDQGYVVGVSLVDSAGIQKVVMGADGAHAPAMTTSLLKARTAAILGMATSEAAVKARSDASFATETETMDNLLLIAGGIPIIVNGQVLGAIAAGGGPSEAEEACAQAGVDAIIDRL